MRDTSSASGHVRLSKRCFEAALALIVLAIAVVVAGMLGLLGVSAEDPVRVQVIGHSWWWEFIYPDLGFKTANELHVPAGTKIQLQLTSVDVLHTLSIPELALSAQAFPAQTTTVTVEPLQAGVLGGECSEVCGTAHNLMRVRVIAESAEEFAAWAAAQRAPAAAPQTALQEAGHEFVTAACAKCHSLNPAEPRTDLLGPNLAHLMSRSVFAGASFNLTESNLRRWLRDTQAMKAGNDMIVNLPRDDLEAVVEYLLMLE